MNSVKDHYKLHLGNFYSWMLGNFADRCAAQGAYFQKHDVCPRLSGLAIDLGAGNGLQTVPLLQAGFEVVAVDFNEQLLGELAANTLSQRINIINGDIFNDQNFGKESVELVVCMGDTLTHAASMDQVIGLVNQSYTSLQENGTLILSFRDYTVNAVGSTVFISVKNDEFRILTCVLEYGTTHVKVNDLLYERTGSAWEMKLSTYAKLKIQPAQLVAALREKGFHIMENEAVNGMHTVICRKQSAFSKRII